VSLSLCQGKKDFAPWRGKSLQRMGTMEIISLKSKIYFITPDPPPDTAALCALVREVIRGGAGMIQYRAKATTTARMVQDAAALLELTRPAGVPLLINDRVDVALAVGADGVHVGQEDMPVDISRRIMGPKAIIGASCSTLAEAVAAERNTASYVAFGPVFHSPTKPDLPAIGLDPIMRARNNISVPICVIGGITADNIAQLQPVNPELVAVVSCISEAPNPRAATRELVRLAEQHLPHRFFGP